MGLGVPSQILSLAVLMNVGRRRLGERSLACRLGVSPLRVRRVCRRLMSGGLLRRTPDGGYRLARPPEAVSVVEVLRVVQPAGRRRFGVSEVIEALRLRALWPVTIRTCMEHLARAGRRGSVLGGCPGGSRRASLR